MPLPEKPDEFVSVVGRFVIAMPSEVSDPD
jgi:hypothetical protein